MKTEQEVKTMLNWYINAQAQDECLSAEWLENRRIIEALEWVLDSDK